MQTLYVILFFIGCALACDIIVHVKSDTDKPFQAQVTASNGKKSDKWNLDKKKVKFSFHQKADECGLNDWSITTWEKGVEKSTVKVTLDGTGRVTYLVGDDFKPVQKDRQGAICKGDCAPL
ncbi:unnamed protein product, partial [Mesorhabditis belari]|uniref:Uncharacterized protein n=1 Tax=Mesorhabditis belari TaxID=2138241 RepID=A0AAF3FD23_9BILA